MEGMNDTYKKIRGLTLNEEGEEILYCRPDTKFSACVPSWKEFISILTWKEQLEKESNQRMPKRRQCTLEGCNQFAHSSRVGVYCCSHVEAKKCISPNFKAVARCKGGICKACGRNKKKLSCRSA